jgi:hypothetical protein
MGKKQSLNKKLFLFKNHTEMNIMVIIWSNSFFLQYLSSWLRLGRLFVTTSYSLHGLEFKYHYLFTYLYHSSLQTQMKPIIVNPNTLTIHKIMLTELEFSRKKPVIKHTFLRQVAHI